MILASLGTCRRTAHHMDAEPPRPKFSMEQLDSKAKPFIAEANAAIPDAVTAICSDRLQLCWLLLKDKLAGTTTARDFIASAINRRITAPLGKAVSVYKCAFNTDAAVGMTEEAALDSLSRQLYASAGLAVEAVCIKATLNSCAKVLAHFAPKLASSWGMLGTCAVADGPLPIGDVVGAGLAIGCTAWCCNDIRKAYKALPGELSAALKTAISATIAQCRQEAASAL